MYCVYIGKAVQTVTPGAGSVGTTALTDNSVTNAKLADATQGDILYYGASGAPAQLSAGTSGYVLQTRGAGANPVWAVDAGGAALTGSTDNTVVTVTGANAIQGEANLTFSAGKNLGVGTNAPNSFSGYSTVTIGGSNSTTGSGLDLEKEDGTILARLFGDANGSQYGTVAGGSHRFEFDGTEKIRFLSTGGITFNGDTATTNALDDYEEGSWTPTWVLGTSGTCNTANASGGYVKIGTQVTIWGYNAFGGTVSSPTGSIKIGGLPFTPAVGYGQSNSFYGQGWVTGAWAWGNADGSNNSAADGYHPRGITVRTDGLQLSTFGVSPNEPYGPSYDIVGQTKTMYGGSSNHGQVYFGAVYRVAA